MSEDRFYVRELGGMTIKQGRQIGTAKETLTYYVMDRLYNCRVVESFEKRQNAPPSASRVAKVRAQLRCAELNEWWRAELADG